MSGVRGGQNYEPQSQMCWGKGIEKCVIVFNMDLSACYMDCFSVDIATFVVRDSHNSNPMVVHSASRMFVADMFA